jgi:copper chaperone CopZ
MKQIFEVENIKCGGCMNTIRKGLEQMPGIAAAQPDNQTGTVAVDFDEKAITADDIASKLSQMGYPLIGENTLGKKAKSYVSCMIGRMEAQ